MKFPSLKYFKVINFIHAETSFLVLVLGSNYFIYCKRMKFDDTQYNLWNACLWCNIVNCFIAGFWKWNFWGWTGWEWIRNLDQTWQVCTMQIIHVYLGSSVMYFEKVFIVREIWSLASWYKKICVITVTKQNYYTFM